MPNIILCGLDEAGKTSIKVYLENIDKEQATRPYIASTEVETYREHYLSVYVIPGQERFRYTEIFYQQYFSVADRIGLVVDASDHSRFKEVKEYWTYLKEMIKKYASKEIEVILIAHKQDKKEAVRVEEIATKILSKDDIKKYKIRMLNTSVLDIFSMYELLRAFYGDLKKVGLDAIVEVLCSNTKAGAAFLIDGQMLPISVAGSPDALKFMEEIFYPVFKRGILEYIALKFEQIKFVAISKRADGDIVVAGVYDYKISLKDAIDYCNRALIKYIEEARKRWKSVS
ncbi:MAG: ADP-ribosylation factor-like protein [Candidatus Njordarchaeota archaeon]